MQPDAEILVVSVVSVFNVSILNKLTFFFFFEESIFDQEED